MQRAFVGGLALNQKEKSDVSGGAPASEVVTCAVNVTGLPCTTLEVDGITVVVAVPGTMVSVKVALDDP